VLARGPGQAVSALSTRPAQPADPAANTPSAQPHPIGWEDLMAAPVDLPAWPTGAGCRHEGVRLTEPPVRQGAHPSAGTVVLVATDKGDVDGDSDADTIAIVHCVAAGNGAPDHGPMQVVAFTRDAAGRIVALGQVTRDERLMLLGVEVQPNGAVQIDAVDAAGRDEWHTYRWTGRAFARVV
jgi:hypothetical protein